MSRAPQTMLDNVDFRPALPGWRVAYLNTTDTSGPPWFTTAMAGWLIQRRVPIHRGAGPRPDLDPDPGREVVAGDVDAGVVVDVTDIDGFWQVLGPGDPDPTDDQARQELQHRRDRAGAS